MKNLLLLLLTIIVFVSCEKVIDVDLSTASPRLVIDGAINWQKGTPGNVQTIKLSTTTGYYQNQIPKVSGATVFVTNSSNVVFTFTELNPGTPTGQYVCSNFIPVIGENYTLTVIHNGQTYTASERLLATPSIINVEQKNDLGLNSDEIGLKINFMDRPNETNFYLSRFETTINAFPQYETLPDKYSEGNTISSLYSHEDLATGNTVHVTICGISEMYYNYMNLLLGNANAGGPFQTPPTRVKGNIINQTNATNYAFGYFRLGEADKIQYIVQ